MDRSNDAIFMKDYLYHAMTFERYVYVWKRALGVSNKTVSQIQTQKANCEAGLKRTQELIGDIDDDYISAKRRIEMQKKKTKKSIMSVIAVAAVLLVLLVIGFVLIISDLEIGAFFMFPFLMVSSFIPIILLFFAYKFFKSKHDSSKYTDANKEYERERLSNDIVNYEMSIQNISSKETVALRNQAEIKKNYNYALSVLNKIYSLGVLDPSYRSLAATATLYQYLKSGICTTVKGTGGIYQTYLYHSQLDRIVTNLSEINDKLDIVISNQRMLYDEFVKANGTLKSIEKEVKEINRNVSNINHNSEISAVAQRQTADAASYMAYVTWHNN